MVNKENLLFSLKFFPGCRRQTALLVVPPLHFDYLPGMTEITLDMKWPDDWQDAARRRVCLHCGNGLGSFWNPDDGPFCCRGCKAVYEMIHQANLDRYYDIKPDTVAPAANLRPDSFSCWTGSWKSRSRRPPRPGDCCIWSWISRECTVPPVCG